MKRTTDNLKRMKRAILAALCLSAPLFSFGCVFITERTDLSVEILPSAEMVAVGGGLTYSITVTNEYPVRAPMAYTLTQSFSLPVEIVMVTVTTPRLFCSHSDNTVTCSRSGDLISNNIDSGVNVILRPLVAGTLISTAAISDLVLQGDGVGLVDMNPANDQATATTTVAQTNGPDLSVTLNDNPDPVVVGAELTYAFTVANLGTETAPGVVLTGRLPEGVIDITPSQAGCASEGNTRTCDFGSIPSGESRTATVVVLPIQAGALTAVAVVTTSSFDPNAGNNTATESTTVTASDADLAVTMSDNPDPVAVGNNVTYTVNVANHGPGIATNVLLSDEVPANADVISISPSQGSCSASGIFRTCNLGSIASGATARLNIVVAATAAGTINNSSRVTASERDQNSANNFATESTAVQEALLPDLAVTVSDSPDPVVINNQLVYTIMVRNLGLGSANGFTVTATLPSSVSANSGSNLNCAPSGGNLICQAFGSVLESGEEALFTLRVTPATAETISNVVSVTSPQSDANPADNTVTENTSIIEPAPTADLSIAVSDAPDPVVVNQRVTYTVNVTNNGPATATGITLRLTLPSTVVINDPSLSCTPSGDSIVCISPGVGQQTNGATVTFTYEVRPTATGPVTFNASVSGAENDPNRDNNIASEITAVSAPQTTADLEIVSVTDLPDPATVNDEFVYTITVRNNGLATATGVIVSNTLPAGVTSDGSPDCPAGNGPIHQCLVANMASGETLAIILRARSSVTGTLTNSVGVTAQETDPEPSNNSWAETTLIHPANSADVSATIAATPNPVTLPNDLTITLLVQNTGPQAATGVVLTGFNVQLFQSAELINITTTQGSCSLFSYPLLTCNLGTLATGASAAVTISGRPLPGVFPRTVTANISNNDPNLANNTASVNVTVNQ